MVKKLKYYVLFSLLAIGVIIQAVDLTDKDDDQIPAFIEKIAGLDPNKNECVYNGKCGNGSINGLMGDEHFIVILDQSGSMAESMGSQSKMNAAKTVTTKYVSKFPEFIHLGMYTYGGKGDCSEMEELQSPFKSLSKKSLLAKVNALEPVGGTPISQSLNEMKEILMNKKGRFNVMLVTDGVESCSGNPIESAKSLVSLNNMYISVRLSVVGFGVPKNVSAELEKIAKASDGKYYNVNNIDEFDKIFPKPMELIIEDYKGTVCLQKEMDSLIKCEKNRMNYIKKAFVKINSHNDFKLSEEEKSSLLDQEETIEAFVQERINLYTSVRDVGTNSLVQHIHDLTKFMTDNGLK